MDFQSETSNKEKNEPSPNLPNNEQSEDQLFFSPIAKFAIYNRFPFNLIIHFLLVIGTTYQLMIINTTYLRSQELFEPPYELDNQLLTCKHDDSAYLILRGSE